MQDDVGIRAVGEEPVLEDDDIVCLRAVPQCVDGCTVGILVWIVNVIAIDNLYHLAGSEDIRLKVYFPYFRIVYHPAFVDTFVAGMRYLDAGEIYFCAVVCL